MFSPPHFPPAAIERRFGVARQSFREEQLAFMEGTKWSGASGIGAFLEHGLHPVFSSVFLAWARETPAYCT
jgi:hypothetical protein